LGHTGGLLFGLHKIIEQRAAEFRCGDAVAGDEVVSPGKRGRRDHALH
jgi:hypothetical protein